MTDNDSPGLAARKKQLQDKLSELARYRADIGSAGGGAATQGSLPLKSEISKARAALKRQENVAAGKPALDE